MTGFTEEAPDPCGRPDTLCLWRLLVGVCLIVLLLGTCQAQQQVAQFASDPVEGHTVCLLVLLGYHRGYSL